MLMGDGAIQLKYSVPKGVPYLEFDPRNILIFSRTTMKDSKYRFFTFSGKENKEVKIKKGKKKTETVDLSTGFNFVLDLDFTKIPKELKTRGKPFSPINLGFVKKLLNKHAVDGGIPHEALSKIAEELEEFNKED